MLQVEAEIFFQNIILLPFRLPKQVSGSDNKVSTLIHITWVHVTIATKKLLLGYSEIHFVAIIISRMHYASTFSPLQTTVWFHVQYALKKLIVTQLPKWITEISVTTNRDGAWHSRHDAWNCTRKKTCLNLDYPDCYSVISEICIKFMGLCVVRIF